MGINLDGPLITPDWVTKNDGVADLDNGPNGLLNFPVIKDPSLDGTTMYIPADNATYISGTSGKNTLVEVYFNEGQFGYPKDYGQGQQYAGEVAADASGKWALKVSGDHRKQWVSATATDSQGNTSEFAKNLQVN